MNSIVWQWEVQESDNVQGWYGATGDVPKWVDFSRTVCEQLEKAIPTRSTVHIGGSRSVNTATMEQINSHSNFKRAVRRIAVSEKLPSSDIAEVKWAFRDDGIVTGSGSVWVDMAGKFVSSGQAAEDARKNKQDCAFYGVYILNFNRRESRGEWNDSEPNSSPATLIEGQTNTSSNLTRDVRAMRVEVPAPADPLLGWQAKLESDPALARIAEDLRRLNPIPDSLAAPDLPLVQAKVEEVEIMEEAVRTIAHSNLAKSEMFDRVADEARSVSSDLVSASSQVETLRPQTEKMATLATPAGIFMQIKALEREREKEKDSAKNAAITARFSEESVREYRNKAAAWHKSRAFVELGLATQEKIQRMVRRTKSGRLVQVAQKSG